MSTMYFHVRCPRCETLNWECRYSPEADITVHCCKVCGFKIDLKTCKIPRWKPGSPQGESLANYIWSNFERLAVAKGKKNGHSQRDTKTGE